MALSVIELYRDILPKTNCKECGYSTCLAFASMVVSEQHPLDTCPHLSPDIVKKCNMELKQQYESGKWVKRDMAKDALLWAKQKAASMSMEDLPGRTGGELITSADGTFLRLPYFSDYVDIHSETVKKSDGSELTRWEQVFIFNHIAQGGNRLPSGKWRGFIEFPNTVSKVKSMKAHVEEPLIMRFSGKTHELYQACLLLNGKQINYEGGADITILLSPLPRIPVMLNFWDGDDEFEAQAKLLFDETVTEHLDIESILFVSERLRQLLCDFTPAES